MNKKITPKRKKTSLQKHDKIVVNLYNNVDNDTPTTDVKDPPLSKSLNKIGNFQPKKKLTVKNTIIIILIGILATLSMFIPDDIKQNIPPSILPIITNGTYHLPNIDTLKSNINKIDLNKIFSESNEPTNVLSFDNAKFTNRPTTLTKNVKPYNRPQQINTNSPVKQVVSSVPTKKLTTIKAPGHYVGGMEPQRNFIDVNPPLVDFTGNMNYLPVKAVRGIFVY